jgi:hypothetical protein
MIGPWDSPPLPRIRMQVVRTSMVEPASVVLCSENNFFLENKFVKETQTLEPETETFTSWNKKNVDVR